jgi:hypothetical protein
MSKSRLVVVSIVMAVTAFGLTACSSDSGASAHSVKPGATQIGETMVRSVGADMEGIVGYNYADTSLGDKWLIIDLALTGLRAQSIEVKQDQISVVTPEGHRVPLPTQKEFIAAYSEVQSAVRRAAVARQPLEATRGGRRSCVLDFLRLPGTGSTRDAIWINERELCVGMLAFPIPGGVQPGRWRLNIELEESSLDIPFDLGRER